MTRTVAVAAALMVSGLAAATLSVPSAAAYSFLGCRFLGRSPAITYTAADLGEFAPDVSRAAKAWNRKRRVPGRFRPARSQPPAGSRPPTGMARRPPARLTVGRVSSIIDAWAWIGDPSSRPPGCLGGGVDPYPANSTAVYLNATSMAGLTPDQRTLVIEHELGHALGLGHVRGGCAAKPAVMIQGVAKWRCGWRGSPPWRDDRAGVRRLYSDRPRG
jgi:hypothetical protein